MVNIDKYSFPENFKYAENHFWISLEKNIATVGITEYAANETTEIMYIELPNINEIVKKDDEIGVMESIKTAIALYSPLSGKIIGVNEDVKENPSLINTSSYKKGWILKIEIKNKEEMQKLFSNKDYVNYLRSELSYLAE